VTGWPWHDPGYAERRAELHRYILEVVRTHAPECSVRGSFRYGDFHLEPATASLRSDLDLLGPGLGERDRERTAAALGAALATGPGVRLRVSIHPHDGFAPLSPADLRLMSIGEYLRHDADGGYPRDYLLAKVCLLLARSTQAERYLETALRVRTPQALAAGRVKVGEARTFPEASARALLAGVDRPEAALFAAECLGRSPGAAFRRDYARRLRQRTGIDPWLRNYVADAVSG
jgi:hypothetical protein